MQRKKKAKKENSERWLLTYSDLITLLMIFFILLYTMSNVNQQKFEQLAESLGVAFGTGNSVLDGSNGVIPMDAGHINGQDPSGSASQKPTSAPTKAPDATSKPENTASNIKGTISTEKGMRDLQNRINKILNDLKIEDYVNTEVGSIGLITTFSNDVFFDSGDDSLKPEMIAGLQKLAPLLNQVDNSIVVEGNTDNVQMSNNSKFKSNWQLSSARAANVVQYLVEQGKVNGNRISVIGYGEYRPKASNKTDKGRAQNRRIDIIILYN